MRSVQSKWVRVMEFYTVGIWGGGQAFLMSTFVK